jgi:hypothetical protein
MGTDEKRLMQLKFEYFDKLNLHRGFLSKIPTLTIDEETSEQLILEIKRFHREAGYSRMSCSKINELYEFIMQTFSYERTFEGVPCALTGVSETVTYAIFRDKPNLQTFVWNMVQPERQKTETLTFSITTVRKLNQEAEQLDETIFNGKALDKVKEFKKYISETFPSSPFKSFSLHPLFLDWSDTHSLNLLNGRPVLQKFVKDMLALKIFENNCQNNFERLNQLVDQINQLDPSANISYPEPFNKSPTDMDESVEPQITNEHDAVKPLTENSEVEIEETPIPTSVQAPEKTSAPDSSITASVKQKPKAKVSYWTRFTNWLCSIPKSIIAAIKRLFS